MRIVGIPRTGAGMGILPKSPVKPFQNYAVIRPLSKLMIQQPRTNVPLSIHNRDTIKLGLIRDVKRTNWINTRGPLILRNNFHQGRPLSNMFNDFGKPPKFRVFVVPNLIILAGMTLTFALFLMVIPILFSFFFPLLILFIGFHQFKRWRANRMINKWFDGLKNSHLRTRMSTMYAIHTKNLEEMLHNEAKQFGSYGGIFNETLNAMKMNPMYKNSIEFNESGEKLRNFIEYRVIEAIYKNEEGIRTTLFHNYEKALDPNIDKPFRLDFNNVNSFQRFEKDGSLISSVTYPLYTNLKDKPAVVVGYVSIVTMNDHPLRINLGSGDIPKVDLSKKLKFIISIRSPSEMIPNYFIIDTVGETGKIFSHYSVGKTTDGHNEYTLNK
ncbi:hypothetical protein Kpol_1045p43 [Vanderwaltozyma polyspora DSM 70294]|uniref:Uncharacterized protein n=1 Tax=Vanderwaltozyma polyspora (strain ATCC 22028 / DSM 70294 / BCRC 21397 / CBS 2163 / NBRC 10782 / NRRL Y-8283 / UCD 57-17) TaxID=436907 RepID=A7TI49_VANPO|nr:uncharacterized protein Kpol_1045p43 [Vanderwaltozyma polyspora DSM 70294]EDO18056.1 hypothetical protein Kpol_1045p43 [Vanderwaltozyma polyspora DSM 70294]